jgi:hypothetical protein
MSTFSPITDADLAQARRDPAYRRKLLEQSLEVLLAGLKKARVASSSSRDGAKLIREGVTLAVRLAEMIQAPAGPARGC